MPPKKDGVVKPRKPRTARTKPKVTATEIKEIFKVRTLDLSRPYGESYDLEKGRHYIQDGIFYDYKTFKEVMREVDKNGMDS